MAIVIYRIKNQKDDKEKEKDRKIHWLKSLVLDYNLKHFYELFDKIELDLIGLKTNPSDEQKKLFDSNVADYFIIVRRKFIDTLISVDKNLYDSTLKFTDGLQSFISDSLFETDKNTKEDTQQYDEIIEKLTITKTDILKSLFSYRGE